MRIISNPPQLYLAPAPLDFGLPLEQETALTACIPSDTLQTLSQVRHWVCENAKSTRAYLKRIYALYPVAHTLQDVHIEELPHALHKHGDGAAVSSGSLDALLAPLRGSAGQAPQPMALCCEAGLPTVADPGAALVARAHALGLPVQPLAGSSALLLALAASGLGGQNFAFVGYLPKTPPELASRLAALELASQKLQQTQLFIETPYRNAKLLANLAQSLHTTSLLSVSFGVTLPVQQTVQGNKVFWQNWLRTATAESKLENGLDKAGLMKLPAVYCLRKF